jgi:hypothetical protein
VAGPCLAYAVRHGEVGVWGGSDDGDRRLRRLMSRPVPATCKNGHPMTPDNITWRRDGGRRCRVCWRAYDHRRRNGQRVELSVVRGGKS